MCQQEWLQTYMYMSHFYNLKYKIKVFLALKAVKAE